MILPGAVIGVLGGGQLGRMFAIAARRMGYRVHTLSPDADTPTGQVADLEIIAPYEDLDAVRKFSAAVSVVTFEFENVPSATAQAAGAHAPVRPGGSILHTTQHRLREKTFLSGAGFPVTPYLAVRSAADLHDALQRLGRPAVLKTADFGYDGKGQALIGLEDNAEEAWRSIGGGEAVLEAFVDFERELSVVAARGLDGAFAHYGAIGNAHRNRILDVSVAPAGLPPALAAEAVEIARGVLEKLDVVGVLCVEFFLTRDGKLLINELAPRPHNSGHLTFDACVTSQFEQQLRAVCGLPLGSAELLRPAAMANLLGDLWRDGEPDWAAVCAYPSAKLHLYGKLAARPGRKMGHIAALAATAEEAETIVRAARTAATGGISRRPAPSAALR
ncbi:MAG TPA: 5-(carboxyamino)imidazole ribonucleotide synthase [Bryobacteraceae bacterium]|nr:5-(carboxyamino)imidazole ribonucleotide synthase [Bryobacteraceae bacterium]